VSTSAKFFAASIRSWDRYTGQNGVSDLGVGELLVQPVPGVARADQLVTAALEDDPEPEGVVSDGRHSTVGEG
jgi:hypothetical protein